MKRTEKTSRQLQLLNNKKRPPRGGLLSMTGIELLEKLKPVQVEFYAELAINECAEQGADIMAAQLATGIDGNGKSLNPYAPLTVQIKKKYGKGLGAVTDRRTNYMTGAHYSKLFLVVRGGELLIGSDDPKSAFIQEREGDAIYKLNSDSKEDFAQVHVPVFKREIEIVTGLTFE